VQESRDQVPSREENFMSLRALRRSAIAATSVLAVGGTLAIAGSASAASVPFGTPTSSGQTSVYGLLTTSYAGLANGAYFLHQVSDSAVPTNAGGVAGDTQSSPGYPAASTFPLEAPTATDSTSLTTAEALQIAADFSGSAVTSGTTTVQPSSTTYATEVEVGIFEANYGASAGAAEYATISAEIVSAAEAWDQLSQIVDNLYNDDPTDFPNNPLFSIDGDLTYSSTAAVKSTGIPAAYTTSLTTSGGAATGYVLPSSFTLTLPGEFTLNDSLVGRELTATQEASPVAADAIGTFSLVSPAAEGFGLSATDTITGSVYIVDVPKATDPSLELYLKNGVYLLGQFPTSLAFPLTVTFDGIDASALGLSSDEAIPLHSVALSFPATTSPVEPTNCSHLGAVTGAATDEVAGLAASLSADSTDGYAASGNTAVPITGTNTVVTDECAAAGSKGSLSVSKKTKKGTLSLKVAGNGRTKFKSVTIKLPSGVTDKGKKSATVKFGATASKTVKLTGLKLTKKEAKAKSFKVGFTVLYSENGTTAVSTAATAKLKN
jgi:hypothetical protein